MLCRGAFFLRRGESPCDSAYVSLTENGHGVPCPYASARLIIARWLLRRGVIDLHARLGLERAQRFVAAHDDFVALLQSLGDFDVGHAGNSGFDGAEEGLLAVHHEHALNLILFRIARRRRGWRRERHARTGALLVILRRVLQILARPHGERLNW